MSQRNDDEGPPPEPQPISPPTNELATVDKAESSPKEAPTTPQYSIFKLWEKRLIVLAASVAAFFSPLTAQIYFPALNAIAEDLNTTASQVTLTITTYMVFQGITPMFVSTFADTAGRRPAYVICFVVYIAANIGLALTSDYASLLAVRCVQSAGSSSTIALAQAVVADVVTSAERGSYMPITILPMVLAPTLGPVLGGVISQKFGWRAIFWALTIMAVVVLIPMLFFFPETCREIVGDGSIRPHPLHRNLLQLSKDWQRRRFHSQQVDYLRGEDIESGPQRTTSQTAPNRALKFRFPDVLGCLSLFLQKEMGALLWFSAVVFASFYAVAAAMPSQLDAIYGYSELQIGLCYIPVAVGSIVGAVILAPIINRNYRRHARKMGIAVDKSRQQDLAGFPIERVRLEVGLPLIGLSGVAVIACGWAMQHGSHIAGPLVLLGLLGLGVAGFSNSVNTLMIDVSPGRAGTVVAANNLSRCLLGAGASAAIVPLINKVGLGWAFTLSGLLSLASCPLLLLVMLKGMKWRSELEAKTRPE